MGSVVLISDYPRLLSFNSPIQSSISSTHGSALLLGRSSATLRLNQPRRNPGLSLVTSTSTQLRCSGRRFTSRNGTRPKEINAWTIAKEVKDEIKSEISWLEGKTSLRPEVAFLRVGKNTWSRCDYKSACAQLGIHIQRVMLLKNATEEEVLKHISELNDDTNVHGIVIEQPLPRHLNVQKILNAVSIEKDVEANNPLHLGRLAMEGGESPLFVPCVPKGCIELLHRSGIGIKGKRAVVIGRSSLVGMPAALLLQREDATVSIIHSRTKKPEEITREADIIISAAGEPHLVRGSWIKPGAVIINVGVTNVYDTHTGGYQSVGDVYHHEAYEVASAINRAPTDLTSMTEAMLMLNALLSFMRSKSMLEARGFADMY